MDDTQENPPAVHDRLWHDLRGPLITIEGFTGEIDHALQELQTLLTEDADASVVRARLDELMGQDLRPCLDFIAAATRSMHERIDTVAPSPKDSDRA